MRLITVTTTLILLLGFSSSLNAEVVNQDSVNNPTAIDIMDPNIIARMARGEDVGLGNNGSKENILGPTPATEIADREHEVAQLSDRDQRKRGLSSTGGSGIGHWLMRHWLDGDPYFDMADHSDLYNGIPREYWHGFGGVRSLQEAQMLRGQILSDLADQEIIEHSGTRGLAAIALGLMFDFSTIVTVLLARYARKNWHVIVGVTIATLICAAGGAGSGSTFELLLQLRLAGQGILALIVRTLFKKKRPVEDALSTANTSSLKTLI